MFDLRCFKLYEKVKSYSNWFTYLSDHLISSSHPHLRDTKQTVWDLSVIQLTGIISLPVLTTSTIIIHLSNFTSALVSIFIGNFFLFFIRFWIARLSFSDRQSTLDISKKLFGKLGSYFVAILLLLSTLSWYIVQTTFASNTLNYLIPINESLNINQFIQVSVFLGLISTFLCMEGIILLKWLSRIAFPILIFALLFIIYTIPKPHFSLDFSSISLLGIPLILSTNLGVTAELPTFFRHSANWQTSVRALIVIQIISLILGIAGIYIGAVINPWDGLNATTDIVVSINSLRFFVIIFVFVSAICANVANVYSASVGWEVVVPMIPERREYLILGLGLTILFILTTNLISLNFMLSATDTSLVNLALILILGYFVFVLSKHPPSVFEKLIYFFSWLISSTINFFQINEMLLIKYSTLTVSTIIIAIFGCMILIHNYLNSIAKRPY